MPLFRWKGKEIAEASFFFSDKKKTSYSGWLLRQPVFLVDKRHREQTRAWVWSRCFVRSTISLSIFRVKPQIADQFWCRCVFPIVPWSCNAFVELSQLTPCATVARPWSQDQDRLRSCLFRGALVLCICSSSAIGWHKTVLSNRLQFLWSSRRKTPTLLRFARQVFFLTMLWNCRFPSNIDATRRSATAG